MESHRKDKCRKCIGVCMEKQTFVFDSLPKSVEELKAIRESVLTTPFMTAALSVAVLCNYENDRDVTYEMLDFLKGPQPLSMMDKQFIRDRLSGKGYKTFSYFAGSGPQNNYVPSQPYTITVSDNLYSYTNEGYATLYLKSSGADSERPVTLRRKGDQWFLWQITFLSDIRTPAKDDPWA